MCAAQPGYWIDFGNPEERFPFQCSWIGPFMTLSMERMGRAI